MADADAAPEVQKLFKLFGLVALDLISKSFYIFRSLLKDTPVEAKTIEDKEVLGKGTSLVAEEVVDEAEVLDQLEVLHFAALNLAGLLALPLARHLLVLAHYDCVHELRQHIVHCQVQRDHSVQQQIVSQDCLN